MSSVESLLNAVASQLPLADKTELSPLIAASNDIEKIIAEKDLPKAMLTQA
jgi:hypothetical protein